MADLEDRVNGGVKKSTAWKAGMLSFLSMFAAILFVSPEQMSVVGPAIVAGITGLTVGYIAGNVADNGVKGAHYRAELDKER